jgi:hypothetical protein
MRASMKTRQTVLAGALAVTTVMPAIALAGCSSGGTVAGSGNSITNAQQANDDKQYAFVQPLPFFPFSQIRQNVIEAEAIDALGVNSTTFFFVQGIDHPVFTCASVGVPVPATDELSNPYVAQWNSGGSGGNYGVAGVTVGQEEPDGIFPGDTTGTNSLCLNGKGQEFLGYNEAYDISFTAPAHWDSTLQQIVITGTPVLPTCVIKGSGGSAEEVCTDPTHPGSAPADIPSASSTAAGTATKTP